MSAPERQPRERPVPCIVCGMCPRTRQARTWTWHVTARCERHQRREVEA